LAGAADYDTLHQQGRCATLSPTWNLIRATAKSLYGSDHKSARSQLCKCADYLSPSAVVFMQMLMVQRRRQNNRSKGRGMLFLSGKRMIKCAASATQIKITRLFSRHFNQTNVFSTADLSERNQVLTPLSIMARLICRLINHTKNNDFNYVDIICSKR